MACSRRRTSIVTVASKKQDRRRARDDRTPPQGGAREACVLDGSEHRDTSLAVRGGCGVCQPFPRHRSARWACHSASSRAHLAAWMAFNRSSSASVSSGKPLRIN